MSLDQTKVIDAIGMEIDGTVVLSIIDGWDWSEPADHLAALQDKLNTYFGFIETGQLLVEDPGAANHPVRIELVSRLPVPREATELIEQGRLVAAEIGVQVSQRVVVVD
jgi:hypothetical protein